MKQVKLPGIKTMYNALVEKDPSFEGIFIAGIKTTGIFCRPTCNARKPKPENVEYFTDSRAALSFGYRPCKVCQPMQGVGEKPDWLKQLFKDLTNNPQQKIKDQDLRDRGLEPARVRRWFKKHHGITFHAYTRAIRINRAFGLIKHNIDKHKGNNKLNTNKNVTDTAMDSGFESLSGFNDAFKKLTGGSPTKSGEIQLVTVTRIVTPLGPMFAGASDKGICLLEFTDRRMLETQIKRLTKLLNARFIPGEHPLFLQLDNELKSYFAGNLKEFTVPIDYPGTDFQQRVWRALMDIPYGETRSYQQQAEAIDHIKAVRAVARSNGDNRIAIIIPCHRVIGKDGKLAGYGGGVWRKQRLLEIEGGQFSLSE